MIYGPKVAFVQAFELLILLCDSLLLKCLFHSATPAAESHCLPPKTTIPGPQIFNHPRLFQAEWNGCLSADQK